MDSIIQEIMKILLPNITQEDMITIVAIICSTILGIALLMKSKKTGKISILGIKFEFSDK